jgi:hypothetical protein
MSHVSHWDAVAAHLVARLGCGCVCIEQWSRQLCYSLSVILDFAFICTARNCFLPRQLQCSSEALQLPGQKNS